MFVRSGRAVLRDLAADRDLPPSGLPGGGFLVTRVTYPERMWMFSCRPVRLGAVGVSVPPAVGRLLTADVAREIATAFGDSPVYPELVVVDSPVDHSRRFPGWPGPVLVLSDENQGACSWGVPLDGSSQVLVGGDLVDTGHATVAYAASVEDFIAARRWDHRCLRPPLLMAQTAGLDQAVLEYLRVRLAPAVATAGWPGARQYRFGQWDVRVMLWSGSGQCDWWISAADKLSLKAFTAGRR